MRFSCDISCEVFRFSKNVQNLRMDTLGSSAKINRADVEVWGVLSACMMGQTKVLSAALRVRQLIDYLIKAPTNSK